MKTYINIDKNNLLTLGDGRYTFNISLTTNEFLSLKEEIIRALENDDD